MRRWSRRAGCLLLGVLALLAILYALREPLVSPLLMRILVERAEERIGGRFTLASLGGTYVTSLELRGFRASGLPGPSPLRDLRVDRMRVEYSPASLFSGLEAFLASLRVELEGVRAALVLDEGATPASPQGPPAPIPLPRVLPRVTLSDGELSVEGPHYRVSVQGVRAEIGPRGSETGWRVSASRAVLQHPRLRAEPFPLEADGTYAPDSVAVLRLLVGGEPIVERLSVDLEGLQEGRVGWNAALALLQGRIETSGTFQPNVLQAAFTLEGLRLGDLHRFLVLPPFQGTVGGRGSLRLPSGRPAQAQGELSLEVADARIGDRGVEALRLEAAAREGTIHLAELLAIQGTNRVSLADVSLPAEAVVRGDWRDLLARGRGAFGLDLPDLGGLLASAGLMAPAGPALLWPETLTAGGGLAGRTLTLSRLRAVSPGASLEVESARLELAPGAAAVAELAAGDLHVASLDARAQGSRLNVFDLSLPVEPMLRGDWRHTMRQAEGSFQALLRAPRELLQALGVAPPPLPAVLWPRRVEATGRVGGGEASLDDAELEAPWGSAAVGAARFALPARGEDPGLAALTLDARLEVRDLEPLAALGGLEGVRGRLRGRVSAGGTLAAPRLAADLSGEELAYGGVPVGALELRAEGDPERLHVTHLLLQGEGNRLRASGVLLPVLREVSGLRAEVAVGDLGSFSSLVPVPLRGRLEARLEAAGPLLTPQAELRATVENLEVHGFPVQRGTLELAATGREVRIRRLAAETPEGRLSLSGTLTRGPGDRSAVLTLDRLEAKRGELTARLAQTARLSYRRDSLTVEGAVLTSAAGSLELEGTVALEGASNLTLEARDLHSEGWLEAFAGDRVWFRGGRLTARLEGTRREPRVTVAGSVDAVRLRDVPDPISGQFDLVYAPGGVRIRGFRWTGGEGLSLSAEGRLPLDPLATDPLRPGDLDLRARVEVARLARLGALLPPGHAPSGAAEASLRVDGTWQAPRAELEIRGQGLELPGAPALAPLGPLELRVSASLEDGVLRLRELRANSERLAVEGSGQWTGFSVSRFGARESWSQPTGDVAARLAFRLGDLGWLPRRVEALRGAQGEVDGEIEVAGALPAPAVRGAVRLSGGAFRLRGPLPAFESVSGEVAGDRGGVRVKDLEGELGSAPFRLAGTVDLRGPEPFVDLFLNGQDLLLFRDQDAMVRADVEVAIRGPLPRLEVGGALVLTEGRYVKNVDFLGFLRGGGRPGAGHGRGLELFRFPDPPLSNAVFDLRITYENPFQVRNNVARAHLRPDLRLAGTGDLPVLHGEVYIDTARLSLPAGQLRIDSGVVRLLETDPDRPRLDLVATTRMLGYDVTMRVSGPVTEPTVTLSSVPPLPDAELLLLVLTGKPPESQFDRQQTQAAGLAVATYLGRGLLSGLFGSDPESEESIADRFELQVGRGVTREGSETVEAQFRLADGVVLENDVLYLRAERDVYDDFNAGMRIVFRFE